MAEVTKRSVLMECLEYERGLWKLTSKNYDTLVPMAGMEEEWNAQREKCEILADMIRALECERVRQVLGDWQKETMQNGPTALKLDREKGTLKL